MNPWIQTYSRKHFEFANPTAEMICIEDIAHALSQINRFTGHTRDPYSVAEHSILVAQMCESQYQLEALLHDAAEAYLGDVSSPLKHIHEMDSYRLILEPRINAVIRAKFGLPAVETPHVKYWDLEVYNMEVHCLMKDGPMIEGTSWQIASKIPKIFQPLAAKAAEALFLREFRLLTKERNASPPLVVPMLG